MNERACPTCEQAIPEDSDACPRCVFDLAMEPSVVSEETVPLPEPSLGLPSTEELSERLPGLRVLRKIGQGGMGAVYLGEQIKLGREVAIKVMAPQLGRDPDFQSRFTREARALARLSHPNIVGVYDFGQVGELLYLVMEHVDGLDLRRALKAGALAPEKALAIVPEVCEALCYAHAKGVIHRDIKPENLLLDKAGRVKIADFGLAKLVDQSQASGLTKSGYVMGTLSYMAPEQRERPLEVDHRADIYSLGVVFYEMLTGELPIGRFAPPSKKSGVDERLDEVVFKALEKEPADRYQEASELKTSIGELGEDRDEELAATADLLGSGLRWVFMVMAIGAVLFLVRNHGPAVLGRVARALTKSEGSPEGRKRKLSLLMHLVKTGSSKAVRAVLEVEEWPRDPRDEDGRTALMLAVIDRPLDTVKALVESGVCTVEARGPGDETALHFAARAGRSEVIAYLLAKGADPVAQSLTGATPLYVCLAEGGGRGYEELAAKASALRVTASGDSPLHAAARIGNRGAILRLVELGADLEARSGPERRTPLLAALAARSADGVYALLSLRDPSVDLRAKDAAARTALHYAAEFADPTLLGAVDAAALKVDQKLRQAGDREGLCPLSIAAAAGNLAALPLYRDDSFSLDDRERSPLWHACRKRREDFARGLDPSLAFHPDKDGVSPFMVAAESGLVQLLGELRSNGDLRGSADANQRDAEGETALIKAARAGQVEAVKHLLKADDRSDPVEPRGMPVPEEWSSRLIKEYHGGAAKAELRDKRGMSALDHALAEGHGAVAKLLSGALPAEERTTYHLWRGLAALEAGDAAQALEAFGQARLAPGGLLGPGASSAPCRLKTPRGRYSLPRDALALSALGWAAFAESRAAPGKGSDPLACCRELVDSDQSEVLVFERVRDGASERVFLDLEALKARFPKTLSEEETTRILAGTPEGLDFILRSADGSVRRVKGLSLADSRGAEENR